MGDKSVKLTVGKKLWFGFGAILALLIVIGIISLLTTIRVDTDYSFLLDDRVDKVQSIDEFILKHSEIQDDVRGYMLFSNETYLDARTEHVNRSNELITELDKKLKDSESRSLLKEMKDSQLKFLKLQDDIVESIDLGKERKANELGRASANVGSIVLGYANLIKDKQYAALAKTRDDLERFMVALKIFVVGMVVFAIIIGVLISTYISRNISRPVKIVTDGLNEIAEGNLSIELLAVKNKDEIGEMAAAFNKMGTDVANMVRKINTSAVQLAVQSE